MLNSKSTKMLFAVICGLVLCFVSTQKASAQKTPPGSYKKTCFESKVINQTTLVSKCTKKNEKLVDAKLLDFNLCSDEITNQDGVLTCNKVAKTVTNNPDAAKRAETIEKAYFDVYGMKSGPKEQAFYDSQLVGKTNGQGYSLVFNAEKEKLNGDKILRRLMILAAYKKTMGRVPTKTDLDYWAPRTEVFRALVDESRLYLYSPQGATDLTQTVRRALKDKTGNEPSSEDIKKAMIQYTKGKKIYDEM